MFKTSKDYSRDSDSGKAFVHMAEIARPGVGRRDSVWRNNMEEKSMEAPSGKKDRRRRPTGSISMVLRIVDICRLIGRFALLACGLSDEV